MKRSLNQMFRMTKNVSAVKQLMAKNMIKTNAFMAIPKMSFSSFENIEKASQKLSKALESEIKYENENYTQLEDIETFLNESGFRFSEIENGLTMTLTKEVGDKTIEIVFEAR